MAAFSDYLENALLNHVLRNTAYTSPSAVYIALSDADPGDDGSGLSEPSGGSYARVAATFDAPSGGVCANQLVTFPQATAAWGGGDLTHFAIMDAASGGNMLYHAALTTPKPVGDGDTAEFAAGELTVTHQ